MKITSPDTRGWAKVKDAARYAGISERSFRDWIKDGLRHSRLNTGTILVSYAAIDEYLGRFEVDTNEASEIADEVLEDLRCLKKEKRGK